ncbi:hypothetical protein [Labedella endophytica]|uniref:PKD domain-containing protein n=1 Tax=Labedella endophytica TaxID=1523160 RepID=A0A433JMX9_9MICO|nr:hypothetical protein [Labedella endophytica]RUQ97092.1 hypothetical protein ELQ94_16155 [Labedella endophytica]
MERRRLLLLTGLIMALVITPATVAIADADCGLSGLGKGGCVSVGAGPNGVDIGAEVTTGGSGGGDSTPGDGGGSGGGPSGDGSSGGGTPDPQQITDTLGTCQSERCGGGGGGTPTVTLSDFASFAPTTPGIHMEPDGWMLRGLPANFIADTTSNSHDSTLFATPVTVRFTPHAYRWDWGDGTTDTFSTPGATWEDLDQDRFTETPTSHTYTERGTVTISLHVDYAVEYRLSADGDDAGSWTTVTGTVASSTTVDAYVGTATTVIVPEDCNVDPAGIGC